MLRGNLAPGGAIIKQSAANPALMEHEGRAVVFEDAEDMARRIDDEALDVTAQDILVLKRIGPTGAPGMPEAGYMPIPRKLARAGVKDMVRISDGRMSGTAAGTIVLHVTPEAAIGGPLPMCRMATASACRWRVARSRCWWTTPSWRAAWPRPSRVHGRARLPQTLHADRDAGRSGVDFDFLRAGAARDTVPKP